MCARYVFTSGEALGDDFGVVAVPDLAPRYNIAPTQEVPSVLMTKEGREFRLLRWGLVASWAKDPSVGPRLINAKAETLEEKPAFSAAYRRRRCLLPADGFYEWTSDKQPYYFTCGHAPFAFAGLWEYWKTGGQAIMSCALVTTAPNELVATVHDRMPVVLDPDEYEPWLDPESPLPLLASLLDPYPASAMAKVPVGKAVGNPNNEGPTLIEPVSPPSLF